jgi:hypothetical protein
MIQLFFLILLHKVYSSPQELPLDDDVPAKMVDVFRPSMVTPVPFGHIFREGIDDIASDFKVPYDLLELDMRFPQTMEEEKRLLKDTPKERVTKIRMDLADVYLSPRDAYLADLSKLDNKGVTDKVIDDDKPQWFNFEKIQEQNIATPRPPIMPSTTLGSIKGIDLPLNIYEDKGKLKFFSSGSFDLFSNVGTERLNWTTCEEFEKRMTVKNMFHPRDIVNIDWEPFYVWSLRKNIVSKIHKFTLPTKKVSFY